MERAAPALLFGLATLPLMYAAGRMFFGRTAALAASALIAFSPHGVDVSRYARLYALLTLLVLVCVMATYRSLEGTSDEGPALSMARVAWFALAAGAGVVGLTLHPVIISLAVAFQAYVTTMAILFRHVVLCIYYLHRPSLHLLGAHRQLGAGDWENPDPDTSRYVLDVEQFGAARAQQPAWVIATSGRWRHGFFRRSLTQYVESTCAPVQTTADFVVVFRCS